MTPKEVNDRIEPMMRKFCAAYPNRRYIRADHGRAEHRGKVQMWVGYSWSRPYAHHFNGLVFECHVAWGNNLEEAIKNLESKLTKSKLDLLAKRYGGWKENGAWMFPTVYAKDQFLREAAP